MSKFSQLKAMLKSPVNNALHLFGLSETKLKGIGLQRISLISEESGWRD